MGAKKLKLNLFLTIVAFTAIVAKDISIPLSKEQAYKEKTAYRNSQKTTINKFTGTHFSTAIPGSFIVLNGLKSFDSPFSPFANTFSFYCFQKSFGVNVSGIFFKPNIFSNPLYILFKSLII